MKTTLKEPDFNENNAVTAVVTAQLLAETQILQEVMTGTLPVTTYYRMVHGHRATADALRSLLPTN